MTRSMLISNTHDTDLITHLTYSYRQNEFKEIRLSDDQCNQKIKQH